MVNKLTRRCFTALCFCLVSSIFLIFHGSGNVVTIDVSFPQVDDFWAYFETKNKKLLEVNASGSWPNYKFIWEDYYGEIPANYSCRDYADGNASAISHYYFAGRIPLTRVPNLTMECDHIRRRVLGNTVYKRVKHPYAVARNVYADYYLQELLLAFSYSHFNLYCYAIDKKSQKSFKNDLKMLGKCIPNVIVLEKEYNFDSDGHFQDQAHYDCTNELLQYKGWDYVMYLQNADIFIKTPEEISDIIGVLNGTVMTGFSKAYKHRIPKSKSWTPKDLGLIKNLKEFKKEEYLKPLEIRKSPNQMFLPREFVQAVQDKLNLKKLLDLFQTKKYGVDEMVYATLLQAYFLNLPGQVENNCTIPDNFRYVHWNFGNESKCQSYKKRHGVCLIGMEYIPILKTKTQIVANKIWPEWDFGAIMCMGEVLYSRTNFPTTKKFNTSPYQKITQVREYVLKSQGKFNVSNFKC